MIAVSTAATKNFARRLTASARAARSGSRDRSSPRSSRTPAPARRCAPKRARAPDLPRLRLDGDRFAVDLDRRVLRTAREIHVPARMCRRAPSTRRPARCRRGADRRRTSERGLPPFASLRADRREQEQWPALDLGAVTDEPVEADVHRGEDRHQGRRHVEEAGPARAAGRQPNGHVAQTNRGRNACA